MAFVRSILGFPNDRLCTEVEAILNAALEYAGGEFAEKLKVAYVPSSTSGEGFVMLYYKDDEPTTSNYLFGFIAFGGTYGQIAANYTDTGNGIRVETRYEDTVANIVATKHGIAIYKGIGSQTVSVGILTLDNHGEFVAVLSGPPNSNPVVMPRNDSYVTTQYPAATSTAFGCTSLSYIPVPTYDGTPHYLPQLAYANATQYIMNGPVLMGSKIWYCIAGAFYLYDGEQE